MASTAELVTESVADLNKQNDTKPFKELTIIEKVKYVKDLITVEPVLACYLAAAVLAGPPMQQLELEKACRANIAYDDQICDDILGGNQQNYTSENEAVQTVLTNMHSWQSPFNQIMPLILILFLGSYSDRHKIRKPFLLIPIFGEFFAIIGCILCVVFMKQWPVEVLGFCQTILPSFFGSYIMVVMAAYSYIADVSTVENRTLRIAIVQTVLNIVPIVVNPISAVVFYQIGYIGVLIVIGVLFALAIVFGIFCMKETQRPVFENKKGLLADIFDPRHAIDTFNLLLKKTPGTYRGILITALGMNVIYWIITQGESSLLFLYTNLALGWTILEYSFYFTMNYVVHLIGIAVGIPLFSNLMKLSDATILILAYADKIVSNVVLGFVKTGTLFYVGTAIGAITNVAAVALRSLLTKAVNEDSTSRALSLFAIAEAIGTAISGPLYNQGIYNPTISTFPSAFFLAGAALTVPLIILTFYIRYLERKKSQTSMQMSSSKDVYDDGMTNGKGEYIQTTHM